LIVGVFQNLFSPTANIAYQELFCTTSQKVTRYFKMRVSVNLFSWKPYFGDSL